jgi:hypothetical protein
MRTLPWLVGVCLLGIMNAPAYGRHLKTVTLAPECNVSMPCDGGYYSARAKKFIGIPFGIPLQSYTPQQPKHQTVPALSAEVIGGRPSGCPHAYCGCSASLRLFGKIVPSLNLASNWLKFPRAIPAPGMAAARVGHVMILEGHVQGNIWMVHDGNSGGGLTRLHARSIAGYAVVDPRI